MAAATLWMVLATACAPSGPDRAHALLDRADLACQEAEQLEFGLLCSGDGPTVVGVFDDDADLARVLLEVAEGNLRNGRPIIVGADDSESFLVVVPGSASAEQVRQRVGGEILVTPEEIRQYAGSAAAG